MELAKRLKELRKLNNFKQEEIAYKLDISTSAYGYYEQGKTLPDPYKLQILAKLYNTSVDYLLGNTNNPNPISSDMDELTPKELEILEEIKNHPEISVLFNDLKSAPKEKIRRLIETWEFVKKQFDEMED